MLNITRDNFLQFVNHSLDEGDVFREFGVLKEKGSEKIGFVFGIHSAFISQSMQKFVEDHYDEVLKISSEQEKNLTHNLAILGLKNWNFRKIEGSENPDLMTTISTMASTFCTAIASAILYKSDVDREAAKLSEELKKHEHLRWELSIAFVLRDIADDRQRIFVRSIFQEIPVEQRTCFVIRSIISLFQGITDDDQRETIFRAVQEIPAELRPDVFEKAFPLLDGIADVLEKTDILKAVQSIPLEERGNVIRQTLPLLKNITDGRQKATILRAVQNIALEESIDVTEKVQTVLVGIADNVQRTWILRVIQEIPLGLRAEVLPVLVDSADVHPRKNILSAIQKIPIEQRLSSVVQSIDSLFQNISTAEESSSILNAIQEIPTELRADVIEKTLPLLANITNVFQKTHILWTVRQIPVGLRTDVIEKALPILVGISDGRKKMEILRAVQEIPADQRSDVIDKALPYLAGITNTFQKVNILRAVQEIPVRQRTADGLRSIAFLFRNTSNEKQSAGILSALREIPVELRADVVKPILFALKNTNDDYESTSILLTVRKEPSKQGSSDVIQSVASLFRGIASSYERAEILRVLQEIPRELRFDVIRRALPFLADIANDQKANVVELVGVLAASQETTYLENILRFFKTLISRERTKILEILNWIPPNLRAQSIGRLRSIGKYSISDLFNAYPEIITVSRDYISLRLEAVIADSEKARDLANKVLKNHDALLIHEEHPLFQKSIEILSITDPDLMNNPKNPYRFYNNLRNIVENEPLWEGPCPVSSIGGKNFALRLDRLGTTQKQYVGKDLPKESSPEGFKVLFRNLLARTNPEMERAVTNSYGKSLSKLSENIVNGAFIQIRLQIPSDPEAAIGNTTFYLYAILRFLSSASSEPEQNGLFSPQETALLTFAEAVRDCTTGQLDGVAQYYNHLPTEFRVGPSAATTTQEKLALFINEFMGSALMKTLSVDGLLQTLAGRRDVSQDSHQTLYLKNRLCRQLGLPHRIAFDAYLGSTYDRLFNMPLDDLMQVVLRYCTPEKLAADLRKEIDRLLQDLQSGLMVPLDEFFDTLPEKKAEFLLYNEESNEVRISDEGALLLLERFGYLEDRSKT